MDEERSEYHAQLHIPIGIPNERSLQGERYVEVIPCDFLVWQSASFGTEMRCLLRLELQRSALRPGHRSRSSILTSPGIVTSSEMLFHCNKYLYGRIRFAELARLLARTLLSGWLLLAVAISSRGIISIDHNHIARRLFLSISPVVQDAQSAFRVTLLSVKCGACTKRSNVLS